MLMRATASPCWPRFPTRPRAVLADHIDLHVRATLTFPEVHPWSDRFRPSISVKVRHPFLLCSLSVKLHATTAVMPLRPPARTWCSYRDGQHELAQEWLSSP